MADLFQGAALPDVKTTQTTASTAPAWYNNFLSGLATSGQTAVDQGGIAGFSNLQNQAFAAAPNAVTAGQGALTQAQNLAGESAAPATSMISNYMNPYTENVIKEIGRLGQQNWQETLAPGATAGAVGSGQFGSRRGMEVYGNLARDVNKDILGRQTSALSSGFDNALKAAQMQQQAQNQSAQTLGRIGEQQYTQGTGGLSFLSGLGAQQQALEQQRLNYPMTAAANAANLLRGFQIPTSTTQTYTGPMPGAYQSSPAALLGGMVSGGVGTLASISDMLKPYATGAKDASGKDIMTSPLEALWAKLSSLTNSTPPMPAAPPIAPNPTQTSQSDDSGITPDNPDNDGDGWPDYIAIPRMDNWDNPDNDGDGWPDYAYMPAFG